MTTYMIDWQKPETFSAAIKDVGLTPVEFAALCKISRAQIYRLVGGQGKPRWETDRKIRAMLAKLHSAPARKNAAKAAPQQGLEKPYVAPRKEKVA